MPLAPNANFDQSDTIEIWLGRTRECRPHGRLLGIVELIMRKSYLAGLNLVHKSSCRPQVKIKKQRRQMPFQITAVTGASCSTNMTNLYLYLAPFLCPFPSNLHCGPYLGMLGYCVCWFWQSRVRWYQSLWHPLLPCRSCEWSAAFHIRGTDVGDLRFVPDRLLSTQLTEIAIAAYLGEGCSIYQVTFPALVGMSLGTLGGILRFIHVKSMALRLPRGPRSIAAAVGRYVEKAGIQEASIRPRRLPIEAWL